MSVRPSLRTGHAGAPCMSMLKWVLLLALAAMGVAACPGGNAFAGRVRDLQGQPVAGALIEVRRVDRGALYPEDISGPPRATAHSNGHGDWAIERLGAGTWLLTVVAGDTRPSEEELRSVARSTSPDGPPPGVAVTRLLRRCEERPRYHGLPTMLDPGIALG